MSTRRGRPARNNSARLAIAAVLALALPPCAALARPLTDQERASLAATVESFEAAMREGNYARVVQAKPPKLIGALARHIREAPDQVVALIIKTMQQLKFESYRIDLEAAAHQELANGMPYTPLPTEEILLSKGRRFQNRSCVLAFLDEGTWFVLFPEEARQMHRLEVVPEFTSVEFPHGSFEILKP